MVATPTSSAIGIHSRRHLRDRQPIASSSPVAATASIVPGSHPYRSEVPWRYGPGGAASASNVAIVHVGVTPLCWNTVLYGCCERGYGWVTSR